MRTPHIDLPRQADLFLVMPATANLLARAAHGIADDLLTTALLACEAPVVLVPSMNGSMWRHRAVKANAAACRSLGYHVVPPGTGYAVLGHGDERRRDGPHRGGHRVDREDPRAPQASPPGGASLSTWTPILDGARAAAAKDAVEAIASALADRDPEAEENVSLAFGASGLATLFGALHRAGLGPANAGDRAREWLDRAADLISSEALEPSLFGGYPGVAWTMTHLLPQLYGADAEDPAGDVDEALLDVLGESPWTGDYDLIEGLVGLGVYALERLPRPTARICLERCIDRLAELSVRSATRRDVEYAGAPPPAVAEGELFPRASSTWASLTACPASSPSSAPPTRRVCALPGRAPARRRGGMDALPAPFREAPARSFPPMLPPGRAPVLSRTAWCYGDLGVAAALLVAARAVGEASWEREAMEMARDAARRAPDETGARDASLCHGTSGLGHLFNRMYQATGDEELRDAARSWISRTLALRREGEGVAGFLSLKPDGTGGERWENDPSFLTGAAGIALVLLAAISDVEPAWDRLLLVSAGTGG